MFVPTTAIPMAPMPSLPACSGNLYNDALMMGPCGLQALNNLVANGSGFETGMTAQEGLQTILAGLVRMESHLKSKGINIGELKLAMGNTRSSDSVSALGRIAAIVREIEPAIYRQAVGPLAGYGQKVFDISSQIYMNRFRSLEQATKIMEGCEEDFNGELAIASIENRAINNKAAWKVFVSPHFGMCIMIMLGVTFFLNLLVGLTADRFIVNLIGSTVLTSIIYYIKFVPHANQQVLQPAVSLPPPDETPKS